jgi:DnaJ-class molecular chaperone
MNNNFFKLFEHNNTNIDEIKTLYRKLAKQNHPDYFKKG